MNLVLANADYSGLLPGSAGHTTDEGHQLQVGLAAAGWRLCGNGYGDNCADVAVLLERHQPDCVFVQDVRDWDPASPCAFRRDLGFRSIEALAAWGGRAFLVLKDAWHDHDLRQSGCAQSIAATAIVTYYEHDVVRAVAPWTTRYRLLRTYHSIDADLIASIGFAERRARACVTGARAGCYPLRMRAIEHAGALGLDTRRHPGYGNRGHDTPDYLRWIGQYRVHIATASKWEIAFRKIIESVAVGCTPVTNLRPTDVLPEIDGALVRIPTDASVSQIAEAVQQANARWDAAERREWAAKALAFYDYRAIGRRLAAMMEAA